MSRNLIAAALFVVLGVIAVVASKVVLDGRATRDQVASSDASASRGVIRIGVDTFAGYFPLCSPRMIDLMLTDGYALECIDDQADYARRYRGLANGALDYAVGTVDAYLKNGEGAGYPGVIVAVIDESKGADAIVARKDVAENLKELKDAGAVRVAFTPNSPSHHLLKVAGVHFDIGFLREQRGAWRVDADGSEDAFRKLDSGQADVATLWEPDVTRALADDAYVKILGTDQTQGVIVDVLVASTRVEANQPQMTDALLANYFRALKYYRDASDVFDRDLAAYADVSRDQAATLRGGIHWATLDENARLWLGVRMPGAAPRHGLYESIDRTLDIQREAGDFSSNPLPSGDPRRILSSRAVATLFKSGLGAGFSATTAGAATARTDFTSLTDTQWGRLRDVGDLQVRPIKFETGAAALTRTGKEQIDLAAKALQTYPNFRIVIEGHTSDRGDAAVNRALSQDRADAVKRYLAITYDIDPDRMRAIGYGSDRPLPRGGDESIRAYRARLPRVALRLVSETY